MLQSEHLFSLYKALWVAELVGEVGAGQWAVATGGWWAGNNINNSRNNNNNNPITISNSIPTPKVLSIQFNK